LTRARELSAVRSEQRRKSAFEDGSEKQDPAFLKLASSVAEHCTKIWPDQKRADTKSDTATLTSESQQQLASHAWAVKSHVQVQSYFWQGLQNEVDVEDFDMRIAYSTDDCLVSKQLHPLGGIDLELVETEFVPRLYVPVPCDSARQRHPATVTANQA
jgi:hypothetical protein